MMSFSWLAIGYQVSLHCTSAKVKPLSTFGTLIEIVKLFGSKADYVRALRELEALLYAEAS